MLLSKTKCQHFYDKLPFLLRAGEFPRNPFAVADYQSLIENLIDANKSW